MRTRLLCASAVLFAVPQAALPGPALLGYSARLTDDAGQALSVDLDLSVRLYDQADGGSALFREEHAAVPVRAGDLTLLINAIAAEPGFPLLFALHDDLWLELEVEGELLAPRQRLAAMPWALADQGGDLTALRPGPGIAIEAAGGPEPTISLASAGCNPGHVLKFNASGAWECLPDDNTVSSANAPLAIGSGVISLMANGIGPAHLADNAVTNAALADGAVTSAKLAGNAVTSAKIADGTIVAADLAVGSIGMRELELPANSDNYTSHQLTAGYNYIYPAGTSGFVSPVAGKCLVISSLEDRSLSTTGDVWVRTAIKTGGTDNYDTLLGPYFNANLQFNVVTVSAVHAVTAGQTYSFGCFANPTGNFVGHYVHCRTSFLCL